MDTSKQDREELLNSVSDAPREDNRWLRSVLENSSEIVSIVDPDGYLRYANPAWGGVLGYDPEESVGLNVLDYVHPEDLPRVLEETEKALSAEGIARNEAEYRFKHKDGSWRWLESVGTYLLDDPVVGGIVVSSRDITGRKEAEEELHVLRQEYEELVGSVEAIIWKGEPRTLRFTFVSDQAEGILGYPAQRWTLEPSFWQDHIHPEDREWAVSFCRKAVAEKKDHHFEYRMISADGGVVWLRDIVRVVIEDGVPTQLFGVMVDVTDRKEAEEVVLKSEARLAEAQRLAHLGAWEWDVQSEEISWTDEVYRIYGLAPQAFVPSFERFMEIVHPEDRGSLAEIINGALGGHKPYDVEHRIVRPDGEVRWLHRRAEVVRNEAGEPLRMTGTVHDLTERKALEAELKHRAFHDSLTSLPNRRLFVNRLGHALQRTERRQGRVAVLFMDLDGFKVVNDSLGHDVGDLLLIVVAERLRRCLRPEDTLARFGGDEFTVLLEDVGDPAEAVQVAERITADLRRPFFLEGRELFASASIGIAFGGAGKKGPEELLRDADTAMYRAKEEGSGHCMFDPEMYERAVRRLELENDLRRAIESGELAVRYQPIVCLKTGGTRGVEALARWDHPRRGLLDPSEFVPIAEESGLIVPFGKMVLEEACRRAKGWQDSHPRTPPLVLSVNLSAKQLRRPELAETVGQILKRTGLGAVCLTLDVTETVYVKALEGNTAALDGLKKAGVRISIDDFGVGYSSLSYLKRLPADVLKIDESFVAGLGENIEDTAIVRMVIELAHTLGMEVVAEGVESEEQATNLREMGCDMAQGYHFAKPLHPEEVPEFLAG